MRRITIVALVLLLMISNVCFASSYEQVYTDSLGSRMYIDRDSVKPLKYGVWDCYKATTKLVFSIPIGNITYSMFYYLVNKENNDYAVVYIENYDANDTMVSSVDKADKINWHGYDKKDENHQVVDKILETSKEGK